MHLHVTNHQAIIRLRADELIIEDEGTEHPVEVRRIKGLLIHSRAEITTPAMVRLASEGTPVSFLNMSGRQIARLARPSWQGLELRRKQHSVAPESAAAIAHEVVSAKLRGCTRLLRSYRRLLGKDAPRWRDLQQRTDTLPHGDALFGAEGAAAAEYWSLYRQLLKQPHNFTHRKARPPSDPINSMLSFGYALWTAMLDEILAGAGFDGAIGFHHADNDRRPTLAIDMVEPFRALAVDRLVLRLWNLGTLDADDFDYPDGACYLNRSGRRTFLREFHEWLQRPLRARLRPEGAPETFSLNDAVGYNVAALRNALLNESELRLWPHGGRK